MCFLSENMLAAVEGRQSMQLVIRRCIIKWILSNKSNGWLRKIMFSITFCVLLHMELYKLVTDTFQLDISGFY